MREYKGLLVVVFLIGFIIPLATPVKAATYIDVEFRYSWIELADAGDGPGKKGELRHFQQKYGSSSTKDYNMQDFTAYYKTSGSEESTSTTGFGWYSDDFEEDHWYIFCIYDCDSWFNPADDVFVFRIKFNGNSWDNDVTINLEGCWQKGVIYDIWAPSGGNWHIVGEFKITSRLSYGGINNGIHFVIDKI